MKKLMLVAVLVLAALVGKAQENQDAFSRQKLIFELSTYFNDPVVARTALYNMLALQPANNNLLDSLAMFYFEYGQYASSAIVAKEAQKRNADNILAIELAAVSFESLNIKDRALTEYENLFLKNDNAFTLYKIAFLQYDLARYTESMTSADILLDRSEIDEAKLTFPKEDQSQQEVPMKAAVYNLKGIISTAKEEKEEAIEFFNQALSIAPSFEVAKKNLADAQGG